jgi:hypothetical protein
MLSRLNVPSPTGYELRWRPRQKIRLRLSGKTVRGAGGAGQHAPHLLSFRTHQSQETLLQVEVSQKTNEIPIAQALLPCLPLLGRVCTSDALHTQINFHCCVHALGGYSVSPGQKESANVV